MEWSIPDTDSLPAVARALLSRFRDHRIWLFHGEMGAGKTTLIKALCKELGVSDATSSPTFSLVNEYHTSSGEKIYHFDFYRLKKEEEALDFGIEEYLSSGCLCLIEWPEKLPGILEHYPSLKLEISTKSDHRMVTVH